MVPNKEQLQKEIDGMMRSRKIFFILSMSFFGASLGLMIASIVVGSRDINSQLFEYLTYFAGVSLMVGVTMLILRSVLFSYRINVRRAIIDGIITIDDKGQYVPTVDVKPVEEETSKPMTREEELVKQYEDLQKQGFITEEELEKKRKEILKK